MRICRFITSKTPAPRFGIVESDFVLPLADGETIESFPNPRTGEPISVAEVKLLAPVSPSKIVCVGRNYKEHAAELGNKLPDEPLIFSKRLQRLSRMERLNDRRSRNKWHEGAGRRDWPASENSASEDPLGYVLGYTCERCDRARSATQRCSDSRQILRHVLSRRPSL